MHRFALILIIVFMSSCIFKNKDTPSASGFELNNICNIDESRKVISGKDTVFLKEFVFFQIVRFDRYDIGLGEYLYFDVVDSIQQFQFEYKNDELNRDTILQLISPFKEVVFSSFSNSFKKIDIDNFEISLELLSGKIKRRIQKNQLYKVLFAYSVDTKTIRDNVPTEYYSDFEIIDIVPIGQPFYGETSFY
jgi:hypothetical protein